MKRTFSFLLLLLLAFSTPQYPTATALEQATIPPRDRVALAQRIRGVGAIPPPPTSAPPRQLGDSETFWATSSSEDLTFRVTATLRAVGEHIYIWVQVGELTDVNWQPVADIFDARIYDQVRALWGSEDIPGIDGDPHVYALFTYGLGSRSLAYFSSHHTFPVDVVPTSNQHEMIFLNLDFLAGRDLTDEDMQATLAHEFQHMIRANLGGSLNTWIDEGFSQFTELYLGYYDALGAVATFLAQPNTQLNDWSEEGPRTPYYGASALFLYYLYQRHGLEALHALSREPGEGIAAVDNVLRRLGHPGMDELFADWVLANALQKPSLEDGRYGYGGIPMQLPTPPPLATTFSYPAQWAATASQYATHYYVLANLDGYTALDLHFVRPETVRLVPPNPTSGSHMWYSNKADNSDTTLTRTFDLTDVQTATLNYRTWFHLENRWDYGYLMVSTDAGTHWTVLSPPAATPENPHHNAYGPGYTGQSGGWLNESVSLDTYAGQSILLRFEQISDDAITQPGVVIDDVSIPEIGYSSDFEADGGGWLPAGWLRIDNVLPQQAWVQAVQKTANGVVVTRWATEADSRWSLPLAEGVQEVLLAVSPFAPVTLVPMPYTIEVSAR